MLFKLELTQSSPPASERRCAGELLASVVAQQARLAYADVARRREWLSSQLAARCENELRMAQIDVARANGLLEHLRHLSGNVHSEAESRLRSLLHLLDGPVEKLELNDEILSAQIRPDQVGGARLRVLLVPEQRRRRRVQIQNLENVDPNTLRQATPRCYGETGQAYIGWALNRMDVSSLVLVVLAYLRMN